MPTQLFFLILAVGIFLFLLTLELIRRGRLREEYSLIWLFSAVILMILPLSRNSLRFLADLIGVEYPPSLVYMVSIVLLTVMLIYHSMTISSLSSHNRDLAQKLAILELGLSNLHAQITKGKSKDAGSIPLKSLLDISEELRKYLHLPDLLQRTLELATRCVGAFSGSLMIFDEEGHLIQNLLAYGGKTTTGDTQELVDTVERGLAGWVVANRQPALVSSTCNDPRWIKRPWDENVGESRSAISVPLEANDHIAGVLTVVNPQEGYFTEYDMMFLMNVALIISQTSEDVLTGLSYQVEIKRTVDSAVVEAAIDDVAGGNR